MRYTVVLPYIYEPYKDRLLRTCKLSNILLVDNTKENKGVMASHNLGIKKMYDEGSDWLIVMSAAIRFGEPGGLDFIKALEDNKENLILEACWVYGWHLIAFSRKVIDKVGYWDENFTPYGFDDLDYAWRIRLTFNTEPSYWTKVPIDVSDAGMAHSIHIGGVNADVDRLRKYFKKKWGIYPGEPPENAWKHPFNNSNNKIGYWPY